MTCSDGYQSPLEHRYASPEMRALWSPVRRFRTWRRLWLALAEAQRELGLDITEAQLAELREHLDDVDEAAAARHERRLRHDVMAHIYALGDVAPTARPIIHLGATSQFVNCNTELLLMRESLELIATKLARVIDALATFAIAYRDVATLGFTHYQPAQPTTVGKRATLWAYDLALALEDVEHRLETLRFRGVKGTTGSQASFVALFDGDETKVERLDELVTEKMGWPIEMRYAVTGQTYPRIVDAHVLSTLAATAAATHKIATDIRLLANRKEIEEPFARDQIGSSAMAYKRNPMRCERVCGMARFVMSLVQNPLNTAATQWLERTLDDSSNRRLALPEAFLALDGVLDILDNVTRGLVVYEKTVRVNLMRELPFMASENILMAAVQAGADRQEAHEIIRQHSQDAAHAVKSEGADNDLLDRLRAEPMFSVVDLDAALDPVAYVGRAPEQVDHFVGEIVEPIRRRYPVDADHRTELKV
ncbi:MAG: adenylosuccinate lyase [Phycisphaerales bacterium]|nr:adenylosuccinate lyase [Phycisphaerae bacterium]NNF42799.1 adenylosuccinate lyase [Phycisphaerales bacterium]NNM27013.1 adenylosuccinate lyase [Phycisphaerales bacterium]